MMDESSKQQLLQQRARKLAARTLQVDQRRVYARVLVVQAGPERYGIALSFLQEVIEMLPIAPLPGLPSCVQGIASIRGKLVSVVDLAELLGRAKTGHGALLALVEVHKGAVALRIEEVLGFRDIFEDEIARGFTRQHAHSNDFVAAVTADLVSVLDIDALLASPQLIVAGDGTRGSAK